ncbi:MAG TPA: nucleotidyl transferase AbiEii/AbiGii toxin family protein [Steroidobacteraceae bacterium]|jgi:hypothetical protein|nr:nucleotidyl transferase AbiEii/AbiGii toxin family protein [Steroidobacteraceae bacterium]
MSTFEPRLDILPEAQRRLWPKLAQVPAEFRLYGGTAIALQLGHRQSVDFDFFSDRPFDPGELRRSVPFMADAFVDRTAPNTLSVVVDRIRPVNVSFFGLPWLRSLEAPRVCIDNGLKVASLLDLAATKASAVQGRAKARDYIDVHAIMTLGEIGLSRMLDASEALYGEAFNRAVTLRALSYFGEEELGALPAHVKSALAAEAGKLGAPPSTTPPEVGEEAEAYSAEMAAIPLNAETLRVARRIVWFAPPEKSLGNPVDLMAHAMAHATADEMAVLRKYVSDDDFRIALTHAPPGIIDPRSWAYWNSVMGRFPPPPLPVRHFPDGTVGPETYGKTAASIARFLRPPE